MKQVAALLALCVLLLSAGCDRRPRLRGPEADSLATAVDPVEKLVQSVVRQWNEGAPADAATTTAEWLALRLAATDGPWEQTASALVDSLGIGAECAGGEGFVVVNLFSRSEIDGPTWPWVFWRAGDAVRSQALADGGRHLAAAASVALEGDVPTDTARLAVLWSQASRSGRRLQSVTWRWDGSSWERQQELGPESLGGTGTGRFEDGALVTRTWTPTPRFEEIGANALHVEHERRFVWTTDGFVLESEARVPSPYASFAGFITALIADDRELAATYVVDRSLVEFARRLRWHEVSLGGWRVAPGTEAGLLQPVFFRGPRDAFQVNFERSGDQFLITGFMATERSVE
jgi:hypothetical protein